MDAKIQLVLGSSVIRSEDLESYELVVQHVDAHFVCVAHRLDWSIQVLLISAVVRRRRVSPFFLSQSVNWFG